MRLCRAPQPEELPFGSDGSFGPLLPLVRKLAIEMKLWPSPLEVFCCTLAGCDMNPLVTRIQQGRSVPFQVRKLIELIANPA